MIDTIAVSHGVNKSELVHRINRKLSSEKMQLRTCRPGSRWFSELGEFHIVNTRYNLIVERRVDLEELGRRLGVLQERETAEHQD